MDERHSAFYVNAVMGRNVYKENKNSLSSTAATQKLDGLQYAEIHLSKLRQRSIFYTEEVNPESVFIPSF